ncbi:hypothetical protein [Streptomyces sp. NPDC048309]|uniref:hypothetical protein n=1 Tax=unclassified Streptomyces TaxID=2593676 RepID=UPI0033F80836
MGVASAALVLGISNTAMAADHTMHTGDAWGNVSGWSGEGYFNEYGDVVTICDKDADGSAVKIHVSLDDPYGAEKYNFYVGGEGNCATHKASNGSKYDLPENRNIGFLFCRYSAGSEGECKAYTFYNDN